MGIARKNTHKDFLAVQKQHAKEVAKKQAQLKREEKNSGAKNSKPGQN